MNTESLLLQYGYFFYDDNQLLINSIDEINLILKENNVDLNINEIETISKNLPKYRNLYFDLLDKLENDSDSEQNHEEDFYSCGKCGGYYCPICRIDREEENYGIYGFCRCGNCSACLKEEFDDEQASRNEL